MQNKCVIFVNNKILIVICRIYIFKDLNNIKIYLSFLFSLYFNFSFIKTISISTKRFHYKNMNKQRHMIQIKDTLNTLGLSACCGFCYSPFFSRFYIMAHNVPVSVYVLKIRLCLVRPFSRSIETRS